MESKISFGSNLVSSLSSLEDCSRAHSPLYISSTSHVSDKVISTSASEVNISDTSLDSYVSPSVVNAAHQVMMSDGAHINLSYVFLPEMLRSKDLKVRLARNVEWWRLNC